MKNIKLVLLILFLAFYGISLAQVKPSKTWAAYTSFEGIKIEYKYTLCTPDNGREQELVLFRYTNTTADKVELTWKSETWRNNVCTNCNSNSNEHIRTIILEPNQVIEADGSTKRVKYNYIFGNFKTLVPGMTKQTLTDFKFQNLNKKTL